jgi:SAM-dependent methyltransferase
MKDDQDAFGLALYDYVQGNNDYSIIIERDDGYIDVEDKTVYFEECKDWHPHYREAMRHVKGRVLDIGCGAGRHSLYLQDIGFDVVGIDVSPMAVEACRLRGLKDAKVSSIYDADIELGRFDTILMLGNNFGLFRSYSGAKTLLKKFHDITFDHARIIAETNDPYQTTNPIHLEYHERNRKRKRMSGQIRMRSRYKKCATPWFDYLMVSKPEIEKIIDGTGWKISQFIDSETSCYIAIIDK